ncbi:MAG: bifunctional phosphopantothenoylcysteine decarboxylase/phosphopantothenate--cysteine ligase CoaBC [Actinomycetota bacterium]|nr:bifunctional phosphopantothenoylcysteine decarboxylase/phosphopantothenate--cysteine ligase CoaBC [Actinomycetota bacterium]
MLKDKKIAVAVTGSIAAYRAADICRSLVKGGASVTVLMTRAAQHFIGPTTFAGLTGRQPVTDLFASGFAHLEAVKNADILLIAPATANIIAKLAAGIADDIVTTAVLAADCPVLICPAMNEKMWLAKATRQNLKTITALGYEVIGPTLGDLSCGDVGWGRLEETERIVAVVTNRIQRAGRLKDKKLLVTAGPTREYLDPVRFISNPSSGKMGYAIAEEAARRGGETILISGPTALTPRRDLEFVPIVSAAELNEAVQSYFDRVDAVVMTAAVADHRFAQRSVEKIAKEHFPDEFKLVKNPDILAQLGALKNGRVLVGFAAQTEGLSDHGREKLTAKNLDLLVAVKVGFNEGFDRDEIDAVLIDKNGEEPLGLTGKKELAMIILDRLSLFFTTPPTFANLKDG